MANHFLEKKPHHLGLTHDLFILPFDHRGSFQSKLLGIQGRSPTAEENQRISEYKWIIYKGFLKAIQNGVPRQLTGILVDEQYGTDILKDAKAEGFLTACPAEKSGQDEFDFEYGNQFREHISKFNPDFVKILARYNPEGDSDLNRRQLDKLKLLSRFCHESSCKLMFELLVPATRAQLERAQGDTNRYDHDIRPWLTIQSMKQIQDAGVEPDVWKLEGLESQNDSLLVVSQAQKENRSQVGIIILGRGEPLTKVNQWLATAATVPGLKGFAIGRTLFWEPLLQLKAGHLTEDAASEAIAHNYQSLCQLWLTSRNEREQRQSANTSEVL
jgi:5-dehydro-2-deoxygluconokinase